MSNKHQNPDEEPMPMEKKEGADIFGRIVLLLAAPVFGLAGFTLLMAPHRLQGATRSATLQWQNRQAQIQQVMAAHDAATNGETNGANKPPAHP